MARSGRSFPMHPLAGNRQLIDSIVGITYSDANTAIVTLGASGSTEVAAYTDTDTPVVHLDVTSSSELAATVDANTATVSIHSTGAASEAAQYVETGTELVPLVISGVESVGAFIEAGTVAVPIGGSLADAAAYIDKVIGGLFPDEALYPSESLLPTDVTRPSAILVVLSAAASTEIYAKFELATALVNLVPRLTVEAGAYVNVVAATVKVLGQPIVEVIPFIDSYIVSISIGARYAAVGVGPRWTGVIVGANWSGMVVGRRWTAQTTERFPTS